MKNKFYKKKFPQKKFEKEEKFVRAEKMTVGEVLGNPSLSHAIIDGIIERIAQTKGPTIFIISDGTGSLALKGFQKPGERAYPEIKEGDSVRAMVEIGEFKGETEGEIKTITQLTSEDKKALQNRIEDEILKRAKVKEIPFLIDDVILDKLRDRFIKAAREIKLAVLQHRPIIVRHHNDTDGYSAGYALERAILPLIEKEQSSDKAGWEFFQRAPCSAPFYEIDDSIRDTATSLRNVAKFSNKMPLVIIVDNGSSPEDLLAIKQGKVHGMEFIVIDHHYSSEDVITSEVLTHINPFLVGEDGAKFSAGMLCTELARLINLVPNIEQIPAMAGLSDRIELANPKAIDAYVAIARKEGYSKELLMDISTVINFVSSKIRFMEAREYMEVIFGEPREQQKKLVGLLAPYIRRLEEKGLTIAKANASTEKVGEVTLQSLDIETTFGFGFYPKPGMCVGMIHDDLQKTKNIDRLVSVGIMNTALTMRATNGANFSVHDFITLLNKKLPEAFVEGGGHKNAGSITFVPNKKIEVLKMLKDFIKSR